MSMIDVSNLTFAYEGSYDNIFENVSFRLDTDWKLGFIGRNGRGKTTFLNLLLGRYPYSGRIHADTAFAYFPGEVADKTQATLDVMRGICPDRLDWELLRELSLLQVDGGVLYRPFNTLSNGEQTKVLLAAMFLEPGRFLLIDEPTNHLDAAARQVVGEYLNRKKGFILVSHDRALLDGCVDHILSINRANIEIQQGNFSSWWANKRQRDAFELAENEKLKREISRLSASAQRSAGWSNQTERSKYGGSGDGSMVDRGYIGAKSAKVMKQAKSMERRRRNAAAEKAKLLHNIEEYERLKLSPLEYPQPRLLEANHLCLYYGEREVCHDLSFTLRPGERIALQGKNGSGKTSLLRLICGLAAGLPAERVQAGEWQKRKEGGPGAFRYTGQLRLGSGVKISWLPQDTGFLQGSLEEFIRQNGLDETLFKAILRKLDFQRIQFEKCLEQLSGGQKKKVLLAQSLCQRAHLYVWDEPLNFIDLFSRMQIEQLLNEYRPTLLFVEHDRAFCDAIATRTITLDRPQTENNGHGSGGKSPMQTP